MLSAIIMIGLIYIVGKFFVTLFDIQFSDSIMEKYNKINDYLNDLFEKDYIPDINLNPMPYIREFIHNTKDKITTLLSNLTTKKYQLIDCCNQKVTKKLKITKTINPNNIITDYIETDRNGFETKWQVVENTDPRLNIQQETVVVQEFEETTESNSVSFA
jgi:hypothetical protein